jgi:hypothetical protein
MKKTRNNTFRVAIMLLMLSTAPLGVSYSYAEIEENPEPEKIQSDPNLPENSHLDKVRTILTEKVINGKLEVIELILPKDTVDEDINRILSLGGAPGWSFIEYQEYHSGLVLFDGKVSKVGEKFWEISVHGTLDLSKGVLNLHLSGKSENSSPEIQENSSNEDLDYRVIFSGKIEESDKENEFAIAFMNSIQTPEPSQNIKLLQFGTQNSEFVHPTECNQLLKNPCLVI